MILVFGGTRDSMQLMDHLLEEGKEALLSVATDYGKRYAQSFKGHVRHGRLDAEGIAKLIEQENIQLVIDASHPFAEELSIQAIVASQRTGIPYLRYERPRLSYPEDVARVQSIEEFCSCEKDSDRKIYLSTGSKDLAIYPRYLDQERLIVRVLPIASVLARCQDLGYHAGQIHAIKAPFSYDLNQALFEKEGAEVLVTKDSGYTGGVDTKVQAALDLGMQVYVIERPQVDYPVAYEDMGELLQAVNTYLGGKKHV